MSLQFQPVDSGSIRDLHVEMIVVVVELIHDPNAKGARISELAEVDPIHNEVLIDSSVVRFQERIDARQFRAEIFSNRRLVVDGLPESVISLAIKKRKQLRETMQILIHRRDIHRPSELGKIETQVLTHWIILLLFEVDAHSQSNRFLSQT